MNRSIAEELLENFNELEKKIMLLSEEQVLGLHRTLKQQYFEEKYFNDKFNKTIY